MEDSGLSRPLTPSKPLAQVVEVWKYIVHHAEFLSYIFIEKLFVLLNDSKF